MNNTYTLTIQGNANPNGINLINLKTIEIFPVPSKGEILIKNIVDFKKVTISDNEGRIITEYILANISNGIRITFQNICPRAYFISIDLADNSKVFGKILITN